MNNVYLSLGTNMGDKLYNLRAAIDMLDENKDIKVTKESKVYETKAWGYTEQDNFLNICIKVETTLVSKEFLRVCHDVEESLHRERVIRWGPRTIDLDILFFNDLISDDEELTLPHPRIKERAFVMLPLMDLEEKILLDGKEIKYYLDLLPKEELEGVKEL